MIMKLIAIYNSREIIKFFPDIIEKYELSKNYNYEELKDLDLEWGICRYINITYNIDVDDIIFSIIDSFGIKSAYIASPPFKAVKYYNKTNFSDLHEERIKFMKKVLMYKRIFLWWC